MQKVTWSKHLEELVLNSWWLILCILIGGFVYDRAIHELRKEELRLQKRASELREKIFLADKKQKELRLHIQHWNSPSVIESALICRLGLIPQGYTKVCFSPVKTKNTD
ncbi:hypothetical protein [Chlamydia gallinacea]|uniref:Septum formation initiator n=2 Tax=Chlamydia gallinacea TaxID=1457153 RepID=A0A173DZT8_9CHLA|nr:hypothetical protein [Chlamydia gallinacea]ANG66431.1 hypothetical protein M787_003795 [Chlamydia gallinacea 08-1274/3]AQT77376.1 hypothetical protein B1F83_01795 [Chlamydia gallinacea]MBX6679839.1 hypothetical protein [Chlamydia gallinacea]MBX6687642.1 hypothetical protein [Chlamydia gallinacea]